MSTKQRIAKLRAEIAKIQSACKHTFVLEKQPELKESLARGIFILEPHTHPPMTLICTKWFDRRNLDGQNVSSLL